jgi:hypothetical protein
MITKFMDASYSGILDNQKNLNVKGIEQSPANGDYGLLVPTATLLGYSPIMTFSNDSFNQSSSKSDLMVFGDLADLNFVADGAVRSAPEYTAFYTIINGYRITTGQDTITTGSGNDVIFGDAKDMNVYTKGGMAMGPKLGAFPTGADTEGAFVDNSFTFQADTINAGAGYNTVYGDMRDISWDVVGGHDFSQTAVSQSLLEVTTIHTGDDNIVGGNDGNAIFGDIQNFTVTILGGVNSLTDHYSGTLLTANTVTLGSDVITTGAGKDTIYGDGQDITISAYGGQGTNGFTSLAGMSRLDITSGNDMINSGNGNDQDYGDFRDITFQAYGGHVVTDESALTSTEAAAAITRQTYKLGNDVINAGDGKDSVWGDAHQISLIAEGGSVTGSGVHTSAIASVSQNNITMGNDTIDGGKGDDSLFGDLETLEISGKMGAGAGAVQYDFTRAIPAHNDILSPQESKLTFGNDTINGGDGNDLIVGDALNVKGLDLFLNDPNPLDTVFNKVIWGNDILTGGAGADTFAFVLGDNNHNGLLEMQGKDTVTDFNIGEGDKMLFKGVSDLTALNNAATFATNAGDGNDTVITFDNNTSITLQDVTVTAFTSANAIVVP